MIDDRTLPSTWKVAKLEEVAKWGSGGTPKRTVPRYFGGDIPWVVIGDLADGPVSDSSIHITADGLANSSARWVEPGAVLVAMYGSIGKLGIATRRLTTNQAIAFAMPESRLLSTEYLFWYLRAIRRELVAMGRGGTQQNISQTTLKPVPIPLPPIAEQDALVRSLESQMTRIEAIEAALGLVRRRIQRLRAAVLHAAWSGRLGAAQADGMTTMSLGDIVGEHGLFRDGDWVESKDQDPDGDVRLIQLADVGDGRFVNRSRRFLTSQKAEALRCTFLEEGDILVARMPDPLGRACRFPGVGMPSITAVDVAIVRPEPDRIDRRWLVNVINAPAFRTAIDEFAKGSTRLRISRKNLSRLTIPVPPPPAQAAFADEVDRRMSLTDELESNVASSLIRLGTLREALLRRTFHLEGSRVG